jgi:hypothetical protein
MSNIHFHKNTTLTPEQYIVGLTDFSPGRSKVFSNSADNQLEVHSVGPTEADVTEGSGGVWERLHYDWSNPDRVVLKTTDSNTWAERPATHTPSSRSRTGEPRSTSSSFGRGRTPRGGSSGSCWGPSAKGVLGKAFDNSVKAIEAENNGGSAA